MSVFTPRYPSGITLRRLLSTASFVGCADIRVHHATHRSGECQEKTLFAALRGRQHDGHHFIRDAIDHGASAVLVEYPQCDVSVPQCVVRNTRQAFSQICGALNGDPCRHLSIVGVTGTNGKTTTTWLTRSILQSAGLQTGLLGTIEYSDAVRSESSTMTTPDAPTMSKWLAAMVSQNTTHAAIELSSHALDQARCAGTMIDTAVITNITHDHLDYHHNFESYRASKLNILKNLKPGGLTIINADDPGSASCLPYTSGRVVTYGLRNPADVTATILEDSAAGTTFAIMAGSSRVEVRTPMAGPHNVSNCLAATAAALQAGLELPEIAAGIEALTAVPGRLERIDCGQPFSVFVDYAHTDDALRLSIETVKKMIPGRVFCVFGAGGDRDRLKRPLLGRAANTADFAVVTSDNPRTESPTAIIEEVISGIEDTSKAHIEIDRVDGICWALANAGPQDAVLITGRGHETIQDHGSKKVHLDDREVVRDFLRRQKAISGNHSPRRNAVRNSAGQVLKPL